MRKMKFIVTLGCVILLLSAWTAMAEDKEWKGSVEISPYGGWFFLDVCDECIDDAPLAGLRIGYNWNSVVGTEIEGNYTMSSIEDTDIDLDFINARFSVLLNLDTDDLRWIPYLKVGAGNLLIDSDGVALDEEINPGVDVGLGLRYIFPGTPLGVRVEGLGVWTGDIDGYEVTGGLSWLFGKKKVWDADGDGVPDEADQCPDTPAGVAVDGKGCPMDSDGDGVWDANDECPDTPAGATVCEKGCPKDTDGDGVFDGIDTCPNTAAGATVDASGCATDDDGDGVFDGLDKCPNTPAGATVDSDGCEVMMEVEEVVIIEDIKFDTDRSDVSIDKSASLDRLAQTLENHPEVTLLVTGHTDASGSAGYNQKLSVKRAEAVKTYLVGKGIDASRIEATGKGETSPIAPNDTKDGKAKNRRVEIERTN